YREEGVGDASIARKVRKLGERYFGLARAMDGALEGEEALEAVLSRNGLGQESVDGLADYARQADAALAQTSEAELLAGEIAWPAP
ncbi:MAG: ubiquinol-cytochrome C chaperone family protein, partial [Pseudomonadota bacterium]